MNKQALRQFLVDSNKAGYAGCKEKKWIKKSDGSTTIPFKKGPWKSHDNFFGGEPYGVLRNALKQMPDKCPFRGPKEYKESEYIYTNNWQGKINRFLGEEQITQGDKLIYKANYLGGLVDQKKGV